MKVWVFWSCSFATGFAGKRFALLPFVGVGSEGLGGRQPSPAVPRRPQPSPAVGSRPPVVPPAAPLGVAASLRGAAAGGRLLSAVGCRLVPSGAVGCRLPSWVWVFTFVSLVFTFVIGGLSGWVWKFTFVIGGLSGVGSPH